MKQKSLLFTIALLGVALTAFSQINETFEPSGSPTFKVFSNYHSTFSDGESFQAFELTRAYLGYKYSFSENWSGGVVFDVGNPKDGGGHEMSAYVKNAYLEYNKNAWTVNFGLIGTKSFKTMEKFWGYRYLLKSFQDRYKFSSSADLGVSTAYEFSDMVSADLTLINGEGYKKVEQDSIFSVGAGLTLEPLENLMLRGYYQTSTKDEGAIKPQKTMSVFLGYTLKDFSIGAEYNDQTNHDMTEGNDFAGYSIYSTYQINSSKLFARYDKFSSEGGFNADKDGSLFIVGAEFSPVKGVKFSPNYRYHSFDMSGLDGVQQIFVNAEIKF